MKSYEELEKSKTLYTNEEDEKYLNSLSEVQREKILYERYIKLKNHEEKEQLKRLGIKEISIPDGSLPHLDGSNPHLDNFHQFSTNNYSPTSYSPSQHQFRLEDCDFIVKKQLLLKNVFKPNLGTFKGCFIRAKVNREYKICKIIGFKEMEPYCVDNKSSEHSGMGVRMEGESGIGMRMEGESGMGMEGMNSIGMNSGMSGVNSIGMSGLNNTNNNNTNYNTSYNTSNTSYNTGNTSKTNKVALGLTVDTGIKILKNFQIVNVSSKGVLEEEFQSFIETFKIKSLEEIREKYKKAINEINRDLTNEEITQMIINKEKVNPRQKSITQKKIDLILQRDAAMNEKNKEKAQHYQRLLEELEDVQKKRKMEKYEDEMRMYRGNE